MDDTPVPKRILLATDLSARCDRALARAAQLAAAWQAGLVVAHVVHPADAAFHDRRAGAVPSWRRPTARSDVLRGRLDAELQAEGIVASSRVEVGSAAETLQRLLVEEDAGLAVLGIAKDGGMDRIQQGSTVDALVRRARAPVLNVRRRVRGPYRHVVVATDFSGPAVHALGLAAGWFPDARLTVFHAYMPAGATLATVPAVDEAWRPVIVQACEEAVTRAGLPARIAQGLQRIIERGQPETLLPDYVDSAGVDLVVLGSHGRGGLARVLLGSTAESLLHALDVDTLVVRGV